MTKEELNEWYSLISIIKAGVKLNASDCSELLRLNHLVMEMSHYIHNDNMLGN